MSLSLAVRGWASLRAVPLAVRGEGAKGIGPLGGWCEEAAASDGAMPAAAGARRRGRRAARGEDDAGLAPAGGEASQTWPARHPWR